MRGQIAIEWFLVAMILLLIGVHEANAFVVYQVGETIGVESQTCDTYQFLGKTFAYSNYPNIAACNIATRFFCGFRWINNQQNVFSIRASNMTISDSLGTGANQYYGFHNITLVAGHSNRFRVESSNVGAGGGDVGINLTLPNGTTHQVLYASTVGIIASYAQETRINITEYNTTHYLINFTRYHEDSAGLATAEVANTLPKGDQINFTTQAISAMGGTSARLYLIEYPNYNCTHEINPLEIGNLSYAITSTLTGFYMSSYNGTPITPTGISGSYIRSDFKTDTIVNATFANTTAYYQAYLYYNTQLLQPKITYYPMIDAFADFYNVSTGAAYLMNNTAAYVYDNVSSSWYLCPPFSITTWTTPYVMSCYFASSGGSGLMNMSLMYLIQNCYQNGNNYSWYIKSQAPVSYSAQQIFNNSTVFNYAFTGDTYSGSQQILNMPDGNVTLNFTIYQGSQVICAYTNSTGTFFGASTSVLTGFSITRIAAFIFFLAIVALSMTLPMAIIGAMFINDLFSLLPQSEMFFIAIGATALSFIYNHYGANSLKSVGLYFAIGLVIITHVAGIGQTAGLPGFSDISARINVISNSYSSIVQTFSQADLIGFSVSSVLFIVNIFLFFLSIPSMLVYLIFTPISYISPMLYTATWLFRIVIEIGIYLWIGLKAYEVISKQFPGVV